MSAYVIVEFTVKDPDVYRENTPQRWADGQRVRRRALANSNWESCTAMARSHQEHSCGFPTMRRPSSGTTRLSIDS